MDRVAGQRGDDDRQQQEPPTDPGGDAEANDRFERLEQRLAEQPLHALADVVDVGRAAIHEVAAARFGEVGHIEAQHAGVELLAQLVADELRPGDETARHSTRGTMPFDDGADEHEQAHDHERLERRVGHPAMGDGCDPAEPLGPLGVNVDVVLGAFDLAARCGTAVYRAALARASSSLLDEVGEPRFFGDLARRSIGPAAVPQVVGQFGCGDRRSRPGFFAGSSSARSALSSSSWASHWRASATSRSLSLIFSVDPLRQRLIVHDHVDDREHGGEIAAPQHGDGQRREHAARSRCALGEGDFQNATEGTHA